MRNLIRILKSLMRYRGVLIVAHVALFIALLAQLATPKIIEWVLDNGVTKSDRHVVLLGALLIVGAAAIQGVFTYVRSYLFQALAERVSTDVRAELYEHLMILPFGFFDVSQSGQLMSRGTEDVNSIRRFLMFSLRMAIYSVAMLLIVAVVLFRANARLAVLALGLMPFLAFAAIHFGQNIRPMFARVQQQFGEMSSVLQENLAGTRVVRVFAREDDEIVKFDNSLVELLNRQMRAIRYWSLYFPLMTFLSSASVGLVLWYGGRLVLRGDMTIGTLVAFNLYLALLAMPIRNLGWVVNSVARASASGERIFEVVDTRPAIQQSATASAPVGRLGEVRFEDVTFLYPHTEHPALQDVSLVARPDDVIALIGPTGSGKSSVVSLIPRFYDVAQGQVLVDGQDVRDWQLRPLRQSVAMVLQESFLFSSTIRDNIAFGRPDASTEEVVAAARVARAHDFISALPAGYDTILGERGVSLSGGQRQRVAIARAICANPRILILDDATSSVDTETEFEIQQALHDAMQGRTTFVIAQRLSTLKDATEILVFDSGRIVERGSHIELLGRGGHYARIYDLQLRDQEEFVRVAD